MLRNSELCTPPSMCMAPPNGVRFAAQVGKRARRSLQMGTFRRPGGKTIMRRLRQAEGRTKAGQDQSEAGAVCVRGCWEYHSHDL